MNRGRFILILLFATASVFVVEAQENAIPSGGGDSIVLIFLFMSAVAIVGLAIFLWRRASREFSEEPFSKERLEETSGIDTKEHPPVIFNTPDIRPPINRSDGDVRPYLVVELRKSTNSFLSAGQRWIVKPEDTPFVIGARSGVNLRIVDEHVSKEHLTITYDNVTSSYSLIDKNSSNGSRWDGDTMIKQRSYPMSNRHDVTLEIAVSYLFTLYIDAVEADVLEEPDVHISLTPVPVPFQLPDQDELPPGTKAHLNWISPETKTEQDLEIKQLITQIGRGDSVEVQIKHHLISKLHAYIVWKDNQFWLIDMSSNGTWLSVGARGHFRTDYKTYASLEPDTTQFIEIARDVVALNFRYSLVDTARLPDEKVITDKMPELPVGVHPLLHIVRDGESEHRREVPISTGVITIGRSEKNVLRFLRDSLDDDHAKIVWEEGQFWMYDLSGTGTWVDKQRLRRTREPLQKQRIYSIHLNHGENDEILMQFWYDVQIDEEDSASLNVYHPEHTQKIDGTFT